MKKYIFCLFFVPVFLLPSLALGIEVNKFEPWDEQVFIAIEERHGSDAAKRIRHLHEIWQ
jgi:hypothetical protein